MKIQDLEILFKKIYIGRNLFDRVVLVLLFLQLFQIYLVISERSCQRIWIMTNLPNHWNCHPHICSNQYILLLFLLLFRFKKEFFHVYFDSTVVSKVWKMRKQCKVNYFICFQNNFISNFPASVHYQNRIKLFLARATEGTSLYVWVRQLVRF